MGFPASGGAFSDPLLQAPGDDLGHLDAGGPGLGLSIVRDTARQPGGAVTVRRREEGGPCFQVAFPRWSEEGGALR